MHYYIKLFTLKCVKYKALLCKSSMTFNSSSILCSAFNPKLVTPQIRTINLKPPGPQLVLFGTQM